MNDSSMQGLSHMPLAAHEGQTLFKDNSFVFDGMNTFNVSESLNINSNFGQDQQLSDSQTPRSPDHPIGEHHTGTMKNQQYYLNGQSGSRRYSRGGMVTGSTHVKQSADGNHFEVYLSQLEKEDIDTSMRPSHSQEVNNRSYTENRSRSQAPSGSVSRPGDRSRSDTSRISGSKVKYSYPDDHSRISTKMSKFDLPMRQTRDFSKALSIFSIKRESTTDFDRTSSILPPARIASNRRVSRNRIHEKHLRVITPQSSESPVVCQRNGMHSKLSNNLQQSQMSATKSPQVFVGQSSFSHESFGQKTSHPAESTARVSAEKVNEHRPMIKIYSRPAMNSKKSAKQEKAANNNTMADARVSNIFFKSKKVKNEKPNNNTMLQPKEEELRMDSTFSMQGIEQSSSPLLDLRGGGPNINTSSKDLKPKRGRQLSSNNNSIESPDSRPQSSAPMKQIKGDISSMMNQHNQEDCIDSPKNVYRVKKGTREENMQSQNETEISVTGRKQQVVSGVSQNQGFQEMGGLIISREVNKQMHPKLVKQQEKMKSAQKPDLATKMVQPSPRFSGTKGLNQKYPSFSKNNNLRRNSKPPAIPINVAKQNSLRKSRQSTSPPMPIDPRLHRVVAKEHPQLRVSRNSKRSSTRGSIFNRQSKATSDGSIFIHSDQNINNQMVRNRSTLSRGLAQSRSPCRINPNERLFTMSGPFNPLLNCGCTGKGMQRDSITITRIVDKQEQVPPPPPVNMSENYDTNDQFESEYEVISSEQQQQHKDSQKLSLEFQDNRISAQPQYHTYQENVTDDENEAKEIICNLAEENEHHKYAPAPSSYLAATRKHKGHGKKKHASEHIQEYAAQPPNFQQLKTRGATSYHQFDSFNNYNEKQSSHDQMLIMHNVSPKFNRESFDRSDKYTMQNVAQSDPNEFQQPLPPQEIMIKRNQKMFNSPEHVMIQRAVVGMSIPPSRGVNNSQQHELHEQSSMVENKLKFDSSNRNISEEPVPPIRIQRRQQSPGTSDGCESKVNSGDLYKPYKKLMSNGSTGGPENLQEDLENLEMDHEDLKQGSVICKTVDQNQKQLQLDNASSQGQAELQLSQSGGEGDSPQYMKQINNSILEKEVAAIAIVADEKFAKMDEKEDNYMEYAEKQDSDLEKQDYHDKLDHLDKEDTNVYEKQDSYEDIPNEKQDDQQQETMVEKEDVDEVQSPEPILQEAFKYSIEKSDYTVKSNQGKPKSALQQDHDYFDSNQIGNEEQVTIQPEQTNDSIDSPNPKVPGDAEKVNDEEGNPNTDGDQSKTSSFLKNLKKSFDYGIEDINGDSSQLLNLNITKHEESMRDAPLLNSIKVPNQQQVEGDFNMPSEIRQLKTGESYDNKHGIDNSLNEVMKVFKDNEKKSKGNFGWNKQVQHTKIRLTDIVEEANKIDKARHMRQSSKVSMRSMSKNRLLMEYSNSRFGMRQSHQVMPIQTFNERMHQIQQEQFGNRIGSKVSPRGFHSKQPSIASSYMQSKNALNRLGPIDQFLGKKRTFGLKTQRNPLALSRQSGILKSSMKNWDMQSQYSNATSHLGARKRGNMNMNLNLKGVMKTQINLMDSYNGNNQANTSLYSHVIHAKKSSRDFNIQKLQKSLNGKPVGNPAYKKRVEKKKEMPFQLGNGPFDHLICQGTLLRYKPGIEKDFVHRWVQMTKQDFRYFENSLKAEGCLKAERLVLMAKFSGQAAASLNTSQNIQCGSAVPLISIPTQAIQKAMRLRPEDFQVPNNRNKMEQKDLYKHLFEIKLKCDYDDLRYYREEIKANIDTISNNSPLRSNNKSRSNLSKRTQSVSSFYASPIPKKKNMFIKKFSKSPNLVRDQNSQNSFNRNIIKHKKSQSRQQEELKDLNSAVVNKVKIKLNKTIKRRNEGSPSQSPNKNMSPSPSNFEHGMTSIERDCKRPPKGKESFYRSRSQAMLMNDQKKFDKNLMIPSEPQSHLEDGTQPVTQRISLSKTKSSNLHSHKESILSQKQQFKLNGRKKSAAALFSKSKFGKIKNGSCKTAQSEAHISFGQSIEDKNSAGEVHKINTRSPSKGSNEILRKVVPGQLMPMPLSKSRSSSKFFRSPSKDNLSGSPEKPKQYNIQLSQGKARTRSRLRECASQQIQFSDKLQIPKTHRDGGLLGKYNKIADAINPYNNSNGKNDETHSNNKKIIQICASNRSIEYNKSKYTDDTPAPSERNHKQQWTQRQQMWFQEERRIIFSCKSHEQVNQWVKTINKFVQEQGNTLQMPMDMASEQFSTFGGGQSKMSKKTTKLKQIKKKKGTERQLLKGLKQFNKGQKRQINLAVSQQQF